MRGFPLGPGSHSCSWSPTSLCRWRLWTSWTRRTVAKAALEARGGIEMALERLEELRRIAQVAKKVMISVQNGNDCSFEEANAVAFYINTFDPMTVLDLLDELEWLWREREEDDDKR